MDGEGLLNLAASLPLAGEPAPFFTAATDGNDHYSLEVAAGRWIVLMAFGAPAHVSLSLSLSLSLSQKNKKKKKKKKKTTHTHTLYIYIYIYI